MLYPSPNAKEPNAVAQTRTAHLTPIPEEPTNSSVQRLPRPPRPPRPRDRVRDETSPSAGERDAGVPDGPWRVDESASSSDELRRSTITRGVATGWPTATPSEDPAAADPDAARPDRPRDARSLAELNAGARLREMRRGTVACT